MLRNNAAEFVRNLTPEQRKVIEPIKPAIAVNGVFKPQETVDMWEKPINFNYDILPLFPTDCLPEWLRNHIRAVADSTDTPEDLAGCVALAVLSLTVARVAEVQVYSDWREPLNLWTAVFLDPSNLKSVVFKMYTDPVREFEKIKVEDERGSIAEAKRMYALTEKRIEKLTEKAAKPELKADERLKVEAELKNTAREFAEMKVPAVTKLIVSDVTAERLASILAEQPGERVAVLTAEGGMIFSIMGGRYSGGANFDIYLSGYSGETYTVDRRGRSEVLDRPALTIGIAAQPSVIQSMAHEREYKQFRERGLLARFLYSIPASRLGSRTFEEYKAVSDEIKHIYCRNILQLLKLPVGATIQTIKVSDAAQSLFKDYRRKLEKRLKPNGDLNSLLDWAGKVHGQVIRLSGVLHIAEQAGTPYPWQEPISLKTMQAAIQIAEYFTEHAKAAFGVMGSDKAEQPAKRILVWMQEQKNNNQSIFVRGDLYQKFKGGLSGIKELDEALSILENQNLIRKVIETEQRKGRKSHKYELNPNAYNSHNSCNSHEASNGAGLRGIEKDSRNNPVINRNLPVNSEGLITGIKLGITGQLQECTSNSHEASNGADLSKNGNNENYGIDIKEGDI